jgi:hypothetical protein
MGDRPTITCRLAFVVPSEGDASEDQEGGVEWRDVRCYVTDDASLVVHRNGDDPSVYSLSHAPTGRSIPTEATGSPDPLIELANRLSRMTDWSALGATTGIDELSPRVRRRILAELDRFNRRMRLESGASTPPREEP